MLEYNRIDISKGIDINKINALKECKVSHYWYFKHIGFKYEPYLFNGCHGLMQKLLVLMTLLLLILSAYRIHFWYIRKDDAISIMNNSNLIDEWVFYHFFYYI